MNFNLLKRYFLSLSVIATLAVLPAACGSDDGGPEPPVMEDPTPDATNANTTISADPGTVVADGTATSTVTVTIADTNGDLLTESAGTVTLASSSSTTVVSEVTDNSDGSYTATVADTVAGTVTISGTLNEVAISDTAEITFEAEEEEVSADPTNANTTIDATAPELIEGISTSTVTVQLADANGDDLTVSGGTVAITSSGEATVSEVTDNGDGTYTATVTSETEENTTISATLDDVAITNTVDITFNPDDSNPAQETEQSEEPVGESILRINSGGGEVTVGDDVVFMADQYFEADITQPYTNPFVTEIEGTDDDAIYLTERVTADGIGNIQGPFSYNIPITNGTYTVKLYFAEIYWGSENPEMLEGGDGSRIFNVSMEDTQIFSGYDLFKDIGAATADSRMYDIEVTDGELNIIFEASINKPKISAIEVFGDGTIGN